MEVRSFLAFELPGKIKEIVSEISGDMRKTPLDLKRIKVDNIHLTMVFLGNISTTRLDELSRVVSKTCQNHGPFEITLKGADIFFRRRTPTVLWIGLDGDINKMAVFRDALQHVLSPFGIKKENRPFKPHLTLGRFRKGATSGPLLKDFVERYRDLTSPVETLGELVLFKSDLRPGGAVYTRLDGWKLRIKE